jgi:hypothetical protein
MNWLWQILIGKPHFVIGGNADPYLYRWYVIPRNRVFNIYVHKFMRDDDDRALHDHPWWFVSLILKGGYFEIVPGKDKAHTAINRKAGSWAYRPATHQHRVVLHREATGKKSACWTLIATGRKKRTWGFWCPKGFVPWYEFVDQTDHGNVGRGCE